MTSLKQIEANKRNARNSTGPITSEGKERSRRNAVRHGLTAETVISSLECPGDYKNFEAAILADCSPRGALEHELVMRLASLLWRLRRALTIETGLFDIQADQIQWSVQKCRSAQTTRGPSKAILAWFRPSAVASERVPLETGLEMEASTAESEQSPSERAPHDVDLARCFLRLTNLPNFALDRLSRYEAMLSRQVAQVLFTLNALHRNGR